MTCAESLKTALAALDREIIKSTELYRHPPAALRSPLLRQELLGLVGQRARLYCELSVRGRARS